MLRGIFGGGYAPFLEHLFEQPPAQPRRTRPKRVRRRAGSRMGGGAPSRPSAGRGGDTFTPAGGANAPGGVGSVAGSGPASAMINAALSQQGSAYKWGGSGPGGFDCSGLVQWAAAKAGIKLPHQSQEIRKMCQPMSVEQAIRTPGALLFTNGHVAISLGDGRTIEAMNKNNGVRIGSATGRNWAAGGSIPGLG